MLVEAFPRGVFLGLAIAVVDLFCYRNAVRLSVNAHKNIYFCVTPGK